jgi:restriction system protein
MDAIPKFHETFLPILKVLENGEELSYQDLKVKVREQFYSHLPNELLTQKPALVIC